MGKNLLVVLFLLACFSSIGFFLAREDRRLRDKIKVDQQAQPLIILEDVTVYRYKNHKVISTISSKVGHFLEPNILEMHGNDD